MPETYRLFTIQQDYPCGHRMFFARHPDYDPEPNCLYNIEFMASSRDVVCADVDCWYEDQEADQHGR